MEDAADESAAAVDARVALELESGGGPLEAGKFRCGDPGGPGGLLLQVGVAGDVGASPEVEDNGTQEKVVVEALLDKLRGLVVADRFVVDADQDITPFNTLFS